MEKNDEKEGQAEVLNMALAVRDMLRADPACRAWLQR